MISLYLLIGSFKSWLEFKSIIIFDICVCVLLKWMLKFSIIVDSPKVPCLKFSFCFFNFISQLSSFIRKTPWSSFISSPCLQLTSRTSDFGKTAKNLFVSFYFFTWFHFVFILRYSNVCCCFLRWCSFIWVVSVSLWALIFISFATNVI